MNINGVSLQQCSTDQVREAFLQLVSVLGDQAFAQVLVLLAELERRAELKALASKY